MRKKIAIAFAGAALLIAPLLVSAQAITLSDTCSTTPSIECLQQEIVLLVQILNQLLAAHSVVPTTPRPSTNTLSVTSPAGGNFNPGDSMSITWTDPNAASGTQYYMTLWPSTYPQGSGWPIVGSGSTVSSVTGSSYSWTVDSRPTAGSYILQVCRLGQPTCGTSKQFTIGQNTTGSATLTVSTDSSTPSSQTVSAGTTGVVMGVYRVRASGDSMSLYQFGVSLDSGQAGDVTNLTLYNNGSVVGVFAKDQPYCSSCAANSSYTSNLSQQITIPANGSVVLTLRADIPTNANSGDLAQLDPEGAAATDLSTRYAISSLPTSGTVPGVRIAGATNTSVSISASATPSSVQNQSGTTQLKWDVNNAPAGAALEIGLSGAALNQNGDATFPYRNILSPGLLDGTTRTINLATAGQNSWPSHGTINFTPSYFSGYLPISGPVNFTVTDSSGNVLARTSAALQVIAPPVATAGTLTVSTDASSPSYQVVAGGTTGVTLGAFRVSASELMNLQQIGLQLGSGSPQDITRVYIYSGSALMGTAVFAGNSRNATTTLTGSLAVNTPVVLTLRADISSIGIAQSGVSGDLVQINVSGASGVSLNSGAYLSEYNGPVSTGGGVRIFRSYPIVGLAPLSSSVISSGNNQTLMRYSVTANSSGPVGILYQTFSSSVSQATLSNMKLYGYTDSAFSQPIPGQGSGGQIGSTVCPSGCAGSPVKFSFQPANSPFEFEIPAGSTYYFQVVGSATPVTGALKFAISTTLVGDSVYTFPTASGQGYFVWSPNDTSTTQFSDSDWASGYGIPGLPSGGLSQTVTGDGSVTPQPSPAPSCTLSASPTTLQSGQSTTLSWTSQNATSAQWIPDPSGKDNVPPAGAITTSGSASFTPPVVTVGSYNPSEFLQVSGPGGTATCSVNLSVVGGEQAAFDNTVFGQSSPTPTISGTASGVSSVTVVLNIGSYNGTVVFNASAVQVVNGHWSVTVSRPLATGSYFINVTDPSGTNLVNGGYLNVVNPTPPAPVTLLSPTVSLQGNVSLNLNGGNQYVALPAIADSQTFTISAWVWYNGGGTCDVVFSDGDATPGNDVVLALDSTNAYIRADKSGANLAGGACGTLGAVQTALGTNISQAWHQVVWVNSGSTQTVYLDGAQALAVPYSTGSNIGYHVSAAQVGRMFDGTNGSYPHGVNYFDGNIDDLRYYNSALSAAQVLQLYTAGIQYTGNTITPSADSSSSFSPPTGRSGASATDNNANLANALTALHTALQALLLKLGH